MWVQPPQSRRSRDVERYQAIHDAAFETSACPVVITLENYLSPDGQRWAPSWEDPFEPRFDVWMIFALNLNGTRQILVP